MRIGAHAPIALRGQIAQLRDQSAVMIKQFLRLIASHPAFKQRYVLEVIRVNQHGNLVRPKRAFDLQSIDEFRSRPSLGGFQHDDRPTRSGRTVVSARIHLNMPDLFDGLVYHARHAFVHGAGVVAFDEIGNPTAAPQELLQLFMLNAGKHGRVTDLVAIQVQDRQYGAIGHGVQEFVGLPGGCQGTCFRFTVTNHASDNQVGIVECRSEGMAQGVAQLAAFVNGTRCRRCDVARNPAGEGKLLEQLLQSCFVLGDVRGTHFRRSPGRRGRDPQHITR